MKEYWLDFSGYMKVRAENEVEAEDKFWWFINNYLQLNHTDFSDDVWDLDGIEEDYDEEEEDPGVKDATSEDWNKFWEGKCGSALDGECELGAHCLTCPALNLCLGSSDFMP